jgi:hypothetical protein
MQQIVGEMWVGLVIAQWIVSRWVILLAGRQLLQVEKLCKIKELFNCSVI